MKKYVDDHLFLKWLFIFERERQSMSEGGAEREGDKIWSRLQAPSCQHRAQCEVQTHKQWDHDLNQSQMLNWMSHPGTLWWSFFISITSLHPKKFPRWAMVQKEGNFVSQDICLGLVQNRVCFPGKISGEATYSVKLTK